jgi:hypothetical protein
MQSYQLSPTDLELINNQLIDSFGVDTITGQPIWRIVWSDDQFEHRHGTYEDITPAGLYLRTVTETRLVPKYRQWIHQKYVLERLVVVPEQNADELPTAKVSYEPLWTFEDKDGEFLPPKYEAAKFIIDTVYAAQYANHNLARYKDPESNQEESIELQRQRVDSLVEELFGDQSSLGGTTVTGESIIVPRKYGDS